VVRGGLFRRREARSVVFVCSLKKKIYSSLFYVGKNSVSIALELVEFIKLHFELLTCTFSCDTSYTSYALTIVRNNRSFGVDAKLEKLDYNPPLPVNKLPLIISRT